LGFGVNAQHLLAPDGVVIDGDGRLAAAQRTSQKARLPVPTAAVKPLLWHDYDSLHKEN